MDFNRQNYTKNAKKCIESGLSFRQICMAHFYLRKFDIINTTIQIILKYLPQKLKRGIKKIFSTFGLIFFEYFSTSSRTNFSLVAL